MRDQCIHHHGPHLFVWKADNNRPAGRRRVCLECKRVSRVKHYDKYRKTTRRTKVRWVEVEDMLTFHGAVYGPAKALAATAQDLGLTADAVRLHLARHPEYQL